METSCKIRERLEALVQMHLMEMAALSKEEADVVPMGDRDAIDELDKRIEAKIGEKERSLGALKQHRGEHGC